MIAEKKRYQKPTLERVVLIPEENVLAVCHDMSGTGVYPGQFCKGTCLNATKIGAPPSIGTAP